MRLLLAALCALATSLPALHAGAALAASEPKRRVYTPAEAAREMRAALRPPKPAPRKPAAKPRQAAPKAKPVAKRVAPARRMARKPVRTAWRARRTAWAGRKRWGRARAAATPLVRQPYEPPPPLFIGDLYVQAEGAPLWASPSGGQLLGRLPKATIVTNMGRYGGFYKVEAPNGAVGFLPMRQVGPNNPGF